MKYYKKRSRRFNTRKSKRRNKYRKMAKSQLAKGRYF